MKFIVGWASSDRKEEWLVDTLDDLLAKAKEHGDIILHDPSETFRNQQITVYDDYLE